MKWGTYKLIWFQKEISRYSFQVTRKMMTEKTVVESNQWLKGRPESFRMSLSNWKWGKRKAYVDYNIEAPTSMYEAKNDPLPKLFETEVQLLLTCMVEVRPLHRYLVVHIPFEHQSKQAKPRSEERVVQRCEPISEEYLAWESVPIGKMNLSGHQHHILVEVVANHLWDPVVSISPMHEQEPL